MLAESRQLTNHEIDERAMVSSRISELERMASLDLRQKARIKSVVDGDENSRFFHGYVNNRVRRNHIHGFMVDGNWISKPGEMKAEAVNFFSTKFHEKWKIRPVFS